MFLASPLPTTVAIPHSQSAEGAKQPSPDREVGVKAGMNGSPEGSDTNQNIPRIKLSALFFLKPTSSSANDFFTNLSVTMVLPSLSPIGSPPPGLNIILSSYPDLTVGARLCRPSGSGQRRSRALSDILVSGKRCTRPVADCGPSLMPLVFKSPNHQIIRSPDCALTHPLPPAP
jgi:hypothetical protein